MIESEAEYTTTVSTPPEGGFVVSLDTLVCEREKDMAKREKKRTEIEKTMWDGILLMG